MWQTHKGNNERTAHLPPVGILSVYNLKDVAFLEGHPSLSARDQVVVGRVVVKVRPHVDLWWTHEVFWVCAQVTVIPALLWCALWVKWLWTHCTHTHTQTRKTKGRERSMPSHTLTQKQWLIHAHYIPHCTQHSCSRCANGGDFCQAV